MMDRKWELEAREEEKQKHWKVLERKRADRIYRNPSKEPLLRSPNERADVWWATGSDSGYRTRRTPFCDTGLGWLGSGLGERLVFWGRTKTRFLVNWVQNPVFLHLGQGCLGQAVERFFSRSCYMWPFKWKWIKTKSRICCSVAQLHSKCSVGICGQWLPYLDSTAGEHFHHCRRFCWTAFVSRVGWRVKRF